ncbi:hypothetical protein P856_730 [Candidatus Endolissoclinum faulkneri L5]|uniref:FAD assembly factor SdhE n=1 Tax=Candidatus Endolissoclinum faulkneri L5 TaxID=1401328 RepID=V9TUU3_9PROT|nr:succinate dehydrogenase assembly factor 2 [Candidatus Endolissoclinum faulkneri]AHC73932.1 hypothetical protein P856_730 [Candidatus Endolissoclinum faulkneri L5]
MTKALEARKKQLRYRSTHTGSKDTELILGQFANKHLESLGESDLDKYEHLLNIEHNLLYRLITNKKIPDKELDTSVLQMLRMLTLNCIK